MGSGHHGKGREKRKGEGERTGVSLTVGEMKEIWAGEEERAKERKKKNRERRERESERERERERRKATRKARSARSLFLFAATEDFCKSGLSLFDETRAKSLTETCERNTQSSRVKKNSRER